MPALRPVYRSNTFPEAITSRPTEKGVGLGPVLTPSPASWRRTLIMSIGWMQKVAAMPLRPPLMNGRAVRMAEVCKKSAVACFGFSAADLMEAGASPIASLAEVRTASDFRLAASMAWEPALPVADMVTVRVQVYELQLVSSDESLTTVSVQVLVWDALVGSESWRGQRMTAVRGCSVKCIPRSCGEVFGGQ